MKNRTCNLFARISNDAGAVQLYSLSPLAAVELGPDFVAGFRLVGRSVSPSPIYLVRVDRVGKAFCSCPAFARGGKCKHADALVAAGLLPVALVELVASMSGLLDKAEKLVAELEGRLADTAAMLDLAEDRLRDCDILAAPLPQTVEPQKPQRRSRRSKKAKAA
jgi:hypothetical protein